jgi:hypothetical protein
MGLDPCPDVVLQLPRHIDHLATTFESNGEVGGEVFFSAIALTPRMTTGTGHGDEAPPDEGMVVKELSQPGTGGSFLRWEMGTMAHG